MPEKSSRLVVMTTLLIPGIRCIRMKYDMIMIFHDCGPEAENQRFSTRFDSLSQSIENKVKLNNKILSFLLTDENQVVSASLFCFQLFEH